MSRNIRYTDEGDGASIEFEPIGGAGTLRFTARELGGRAVVDLTAADVELFLVDLRDLAGIVEQKRETRTCGCPPDESRCATPRCKVHGCPLVATYTVQEVNGPLAVCHDHFTAWTKAQPV